MRILFVCPYVPCVGVHAGGAHMYEVIKGLARRHDVSVVTFYEQESEREYLEELQGLCQEMVAIRRVPPFHKRNPWIIEPYVADEFHSAAMEGAIRKLSDDKPFDVVQFEYTQMAQYSPLAGSACTLLLEHEVTFSSFLRSIPYQSSLWSKARAFVGWALMLDYELRACRSVDEVITVTEEDRAELLAFEPRLHVSVEPMGVDCAFFRPLDVPVEPHSIVFVGFFRHVPNAHGMRRFCSEIFPLVRAEIPEARLYIVGSHATEEIRSLGNLDGVTVTGWVEDVRPFIARSAAFVAPLWLGTGMRGKILEAWSMARPVVTTTVGSRGLDAVEGEHILVADDAESYARQVIAILRDPSLRERIGQNGRQFVESRYDWQVIVRRREEIFEQALARRASQNRSR